MIFRCVVDISESEYVKDIEKYKEPTPIHKSLENDLTDEVNWIHSHESIIIGAACEYIWYLYYDEFIDKMILSKYKFYELIKKELNVETKVVKISQDNIKRCFVEVK